MEENTMGIREKMANAKKSNWITQGIPEAEVKSIVQLAKISAQIERCRLDMEMTQEEFAQYLGVSQGMVSRWENRDYNFTVKSLNDICQKLNLSLTIDMLPIEAVKDYNVVNWDGEIMSVKTPKKAWLENYDIEGAIA